MATTEAVPSNASVERTAEGRGGPNDDSAVSHGIAAHGVTRVMPEAADIAVRILPHCPSFVDAERLDQYAAEHTRGRREPPG